ncbi:MAG: hypothetical protein M3Q07_06370 [Pseudobdellovibrionaceae bacterium]|nr:hypothetical protein [Pseudobdellovibrionaceae bacterium]
MLQRFGYNPATPNMMGVPNIVVDGYPHRPLEYQAWKLCESTQRARCSQSMDLLLLSYNNLVNTHFSPEKADAVSFVEPNPGKVRLDYSFDRAFKYLNVRNSEVLSLIESTSVKLKERTESYVGSQNPSDIEKAIVDEFKNLGMKAASVSADEHAVFASTDAFISKLTDMNLEVGNMTRGYECTSTAAPAFAEAFNASVDKYNTNVKDASSALMIIRKEIHGRSQQRGNLLSLAYYKLKYGFYKKIAGIRGQQIDQVIDQLYQDLALDKVLWQVTEWWTAASVKGLAGGLHTTYYFYSEPLRILRAEKEKATKFKEVVAGLNGIEQINRDTALKSIDSKISMIDSDIAFIQKYRWEGFLGLQKKYAQQRAAALPNNLICQEKTRDFLAKASTVTTLSQFDSVSPYYKITVDICKR